MPAVSQLAEVRGQNTSEGGQVNLGPAVAVVVRAQAAAENNTDVFIVSVNLLTLHLAGWDLWMLWRWYVRLARSGLGSIAPPRPRHLRC